MAGPAAPAGIGWSRRITRALVIFVSEAMGTGASGPDCSEYPRAGMAMAPCPLAGHGRDGLAPATVTWADTPTCRAGAVRGRLIRTAPAQVTETRTSTATRTMAHRSRRCVRRRPRALGTRRRTSAAPRRLRAGPGRAVGDGKGPRGSHGAGGGAPGPGSDGSGGGDIHRRGDVHHDRRGERYGPGGLARFSGGRTRCPASPAVRPPALRRHRRSAGVQFLGRHEHSPGLGSLGRTDHAPALEQVHQPAGPGEAHPELALQHRRGP